MRKKIDKDENEERKTVARYKKFVTQRNPFPPKKFTPRHKLDPAKEEGDRDRVG